MDELEARVRCLEVAERLARAQGKTDAASVVNLQTELYAGVTSGSSTDKPQTDGSGAPRPTGRGPGKRQAPA